MPVPYLVFAAGDNPLELQNELNERAKQGYRLVGVVPAKPGVKPFIILEKEEGS